MTKYATWWVWLWGCVAATLLTLIFFMPYKWWVVAAFALFGTMEAVGVFGPDPGRYPPLTDVIHRYLPYWVTLPAIGVFWASALCIWAKLSHPLMIALMVGLLLWLIAHFTERYDY